MHIYTRGLCAGKSGFQELGVQELTLPVKQPASESMVEQAVRRQGLAGENRTLGLWKADLVPRPTPLSPRAAVRMERLCSTYHTATWPEDTGASWL